jgi:uncharacterized membrane protein YdjX (TVP38/TMEM64 family)
MLSAHDIVTCILIYLAIGAVLWMLLDGLGFVRAQILDWNARGKKLSALSFFLAILLVVVAWPKFVWVMLRGVRVSR